jgi:L-ascorbate metabolism protein UlaG (beta-lactamase superfamily)
MRASLLLALLLVAGCEHAGPPSAASGPSSRVQPVTPSSASPGITVEEAFAADTFATSAGPVKIHPVYHATLWLEIGSKIVWVDPWSKGKLDGPKADVVLITDIHQDHFDEPGLAAVRKPGSVVVAPKVIADKVPGAVVLANGEKKDLGFMTVEAVPMYNLVRGPEAGKLFHDKGRGNGYVIEVGKKRFYLSGDTECTPEMKALQSIDVAFVCMNLPYTMPPAEAGACVAAFKPKVLYPYHYRDSNLDELDKALAGSGVEVRRRSWY